MASTVKDIMSLSQPAEAELLVSVFDLTYFTRYSRGTPSAKLFRQMSEFAGLCSHFVRSRGGLMIKFIGDAGLCVFPAQDASAAVIALGRIEIQYGCLVKGANSGQPLSSELPLWTSHDRTHAWLRGPKPDRRHRRHRQYMLHYE
jgi:class 3 adenylate cyclase